MTARKLAENICRELRHAGHRAYFVGGCVRDLLRGREPADYDVATDALPDRVQQLFPGSRAVGAQFGVVLAVQGDAMVEVATFRSDFGYSDGRHPDEVAYTSDPEKDARRRDFTMNGLMLDPQTNEVMDFVGGRADIERKLVRAIGDPELRFREDKLRMVRAVRFAARFGFEIQEKTFSAVRALAREISLVSPERLRDELTRILTEGAARLGFELLDEAGLLEILLPEIVRMKGVEQPPQFHPEGDVWIHTRLMLERLPEGCSSTLAWGVLLHDVGKPATFSPPSAPGDRIRFDHHVEVGARMAESICQRLRFSNEETEQIVSLVLNHLRFKDVFAMRPSTLKRFVRLPLFQEHLDLHRFDCLASHGQLDSYEFVRHFLEETPEEEVRPVRLITGEDLKLMGLKPGPEFKRILHAVEDAQLEGRLANKEQALEFVRQHLAEKP